MKVFFVALLLASPFNVYAQTSTPVQIAFPAESSTGVGFIVKTNSLEPMKTQIGAVQSCFVQSHGSEISVEAEIDPGYVGDPVSADFKGAKVEYLDGNSYVRYTVAVAPMHEDRFCGSEPVTGGNQILTIQTYRKLPVYELKTTYNCGHHKPYVHSMTTTCDLNFSSKE